MLFRSAENGFKDGDTLKQGGWVISEWYVDILENLGGVLVARRKMHPEDLKTILEYLKGCPIGCKQTYSL